ncbi:hypothetical protein SCUCBS95973_009803 [Sporothrix curviconia]|uniref:Uncharacterized protein n=1 Tax=Sporothrix curviconia TaxID=1260050 RepID=A0ABP0CY02_9PEZI
MSLDISLADAALSNFMHAYAANSMFEYLPKFYNQWAIQMGEILDVFAELRTAETAQIKPSL